MSSVWVASMIVLWVLVMILAFLLAGTMRQVGLLQLRIGTDPGPLITDAGLERGVVAPDFNAIDVEEFDGTSYTWKQLAKLDARPRLLTFLSPACLSCRDLVPHLNEVVETRSDELDFLVICRGEFEACRRFKQSTRLKAPTVVDLSGEIEGSYQVSFTPFAYLLDPDRRVLIRGVVNDWTQLEALLEQEGTPERGRGWGTVGVETLAPIDGGEK